jgi:hypothetical protein
MSKDIFEYHNWVTTGIWCVEARCAVKHPTTHSAKLNTKYSATQISMIPLLRKTDLQGSKVCEGIKTTKLSKSLKLAREIHLLMY